VNPDWPHETIAEEEFSRIGGYEESPVLATFDDEDARALPDQT
jgi:hypothetical protein